MLSRIASRFSLIFTESYKARGRHLKVPRNTIHEKDIYPTNRGLRKIDGHKSAVPAAHVVFNASYLGRLSAYASGVEQLSKAANTQPRKETSEALDGIAIADLCTRPATSEPGGLFLRTFIFATSGLKM